VASRGHRVDGGEVSSGGATWEAEDRRGSAKSEWERERGEVSCGVDGQVFRIRSTKRATRGASRACIRAVYFWTSRRGLGAYGVDAIGVGSAFGCLSLRSRWFVRYRGIGREMVANQCD